MSKFFSFRIFNVGIFAISVLTAAAFFNCSRSQFETIDVSEIIHASRHPVQKYEMSSQIPLLPITAPACDGTWPQQGIFNCDSNGVQQQLICGCKPPLADDSNYWINLGGACYTHQTGNQCNTGVKTPQACPSNWADLGEKICDIDGKERQVLCGCLPPEHDNPNLWVALGGNCFTHYTGGTNCPLTPNPKQRYFGYYAGAMDGVGSENYIPEFPDFSNYVFIHSGQMGEKIRQAESLGLKVMLSFNWFFFDENLRLRPNFQDLFRSQVAPHIRKHRSTIIAIYTLDEPYMNARIQGISDQEMLQSLETVGQFLKSEFPEIPLAMIISKEESDRNSPMPSSHDWFGLDCYDGFDSCNIPRMMTKLRNQINGLTQTDGKPRYLMAVPASGFELGRKNESHVLRDLPKYRDLVMSDPQYKVVMPFLWQSMGGKEPWRGTRELPEIKELYRNFYIDFVTREL